MKKSTKAALLSGLVFPGIGHLVSKSYFRAIVLALTALTATYVIFDISMRQAMSIVDSINAGEVPLDSASISELVNASSNASDASAANTAMIVIVVVWLVGIIDSWRLGNALDKRSDSSPGKDPDDSAQA